MDDVGKWWLMNVIMVWRQAASAVRPGRDGVLRRGQQLHNEGLSEPGHRRDGEACGAQQFLRPWSGLLSLR